MGGIVIPEDYDIDVGEKLRGGSEGADVSDGI